jgi:hypothetical protein
VDVVVATVVGVDGAVVAGLTVVPVFPVVGVAAGVVAGTVAGFVIDGVFESLGWLG